MAASMGVDVGDDSDSRRSNKDHDFKGHSSVAALPFSVGYESMVEE